MVSVMSRSLRNLLAFCFGLALPLLLIPQPAAAYWAHAKTFCIYGPNPCPADVYTPWLDDMASKGIPAYVGKGYTSYGRRNGYSWAGDGPPPALDCDTNLCNQPLIDQQPSEENCEENGQYFDAENNSCVDSCPGLTWGGSCIRPPEPENQCDSTSPDFQGTAGWGDNQVAVCGGESTCGAGEKYQYFENSDGSITGACVADDSGVPECPGGVKGMAVITEWGYTCQAVDSPDQPEAPNTDTDGDGKPDTYDRTNDPDAMGKGFDKLGDKMDKTNQLLTNLNNKAMGGGGGASGGGEGLKNEAGDDYLDGIEDNTKRSADNSDELNGALKPNGELTSTENTFGGITDQFLTDVQGAPILSAFDAVSVSGACQVYEIDASAVGLGSYSFGYHCAFADQYGAWLGALMLGLYALAGIRIFTSA